MRFILAAIAFVASLAMFIAAGVHIAASASGTSVTASGSTGSSAPYAVIPSSVLTSHAGAQSIVIQGSGPMTAVVGRDADIAGWLGDARHTTFAAGEENALVESQVGSAGDFVSPKGSDLWTEEASGDGTLTLDTELPPGYSILVSSDQGGPALSSAQVTWPLSGRAPWSGPLLLGGSLLLVLAAGLLLWALLHLRSERRALSAGSNGPVPVMRATPARPVAAAAAAAAAVPAGATAGESTGEPVDEPAATLEDGAEPTEPAGIDADADAETRVMPAVRDADEAETAALTGELADADGDADPALAPLAAAEADGDAYAAFQPPADDRAELAVDEATAEPTPTEPEMSEPEMTEPAADERTVSASVVEAAGAPQADAAEPVAADEPAAEEPAAAELQADDRKHDDRKDDEPRDGGSGPAEPAVVPAPADDAEKWRRPRGRNRAQAPKRLFRLAPILAISAVALTGCSADMWPEALGGPEEHPTATPTSTVEQALINEGAPMPVVSDAQLARIIDDARTVAQAADAAHDPALLAPRFDGAALIERTAKYQAHKADPTQPDPAAFPSGEIAYAVPEATSEWPRTVFAIIQPGDQGALPTAVTLVQATARDPYKVVSLVQLTPTAALPEAAPASIGAESLSQVGPGLEIAPDQLAAAYGDLVTNGDASPYAAQFDLAADPLLPQIGAAYRQQQLSGIDQAASTIAFSNRPGAQAPAGVAALNHGAIVAVSLEEVEKISAKTKLATIKVTGATAALAGTAQSSSGFEKIYADQLLFYVPPAGSGGQIRLLGYSQTLASARQLAANEV